MLFWFFNAREGDVAMASFSFGGGAASTIGDVPTGYNKDGMMKLTFLHSDPFVARLRDGDPLAEVPSLNPTEWGILLSVAQSASGATPASSCSGQSKIIIERTHATRVHFMEALRTSSVVYFSGHGFMSKTGENVLGLEDEAHVGCVDPLSAEALRAALDHSPLRSGPDLVILSACHSEEIGHALHNCGVPRVIAVRKDVGVTDQACNVFMTSLIAGLVAGETLTNAFTRAQIDIRDERLRLDSQ